MLGEPVRSDEPGSELPVALSDFSRRVYRVVQCIPCGMVTTYGAIAEQLGDPRKAREVGWALHAKPKDVAAPAHRVVNREGRLTGGWAFGGPQVQEALLEAEGVEFLSDGRVDMARHFWRPDVGLWTETSNGCRRCHE